MNTMKNSFRKAKTLMADLRSNSSGLAMIEFAVVLPVMMTMAVGGVETVNFSQVLMRINQIALHVADNAARKGEADPAAPLAERRLYEIDIQDVMTGATHEGRGLALDGSHPVLNTATNQIIAAGNARIILSSLEPVANPNPTNRYKIHWQRCGGPGTQYTSSYGTVSNSQNIVAMGPTGRQVIAPQSGATMFAEIKYHYEPILGIAFSSLIERDVGTAASMVVRENRNLAGPTGGGIYPSPDVTPMVCNF